jgi:carbamoyl-phosphate synthase large subunit
MTIPQDLQDQIIENTKALAHELKVIGLLNIQFAIQGGDLYILEVNPRASRTVPFVSKTTGVSLAKVALKVMLGKKLKDIGLTRMKKFPFVSVKEAVLPFNKFPGVDTLLSPEMKSTGEVMGISYNFGESYYKAELAAGDSLPMSGTVFFSLNDNHKAQMVDDVKKLSENGFNIIATKGTSKFFNEHGIKCEHVFKVNEGRPNVVDRIKDGDVQFVINTPLGKVTRDDAYLIRQAAVRYHIPSTTTVAGAKAAINGLLHIKNTGELSVKPVQEYYKEVK